MATTNPEEQIRDKAKAVIQDFNGFQFRKNEEYDEVMSTKTSTFAAVFYKLK
jgi:hypothetical protein